MFILSMANSLSFSILNVVLVCESNRLVHKVTSMTRNVRFFSSSANIMV